jgi:RNA polymerase sigma-70 factor (ECF subfamily)
MTRCEGRAATVLARSLSRKPAAGCAIALNDAARGGIFTSPCHHRQKPAKVFTVPDSPSVRVQRCLDRLRAGDSAARDELFNHACERLERLTRKMLRDYPAVRRWEQTGDVLQNASLRLCRALDKVSLSDARAFYGLAALQIRRELIDLARRYYGAQGAGAHHASQGPFDPHASARPPAYEALDSSGEPTHEIAWAEFHEKVAGLPDDERELFDLLWYQGLKQEEAADLLGVHVRTVRNHWRSIRLKLYEALGGSLPPL